MDKICGICGGWDKNNKEKYGDRYWCEIKGDYVKLKDKYETCRNFFFQPDRQEGYKSNEFKPWGLHIITLVYQLLGLEDDEIIRDVIESGLDYKYSKDDFKDVLFEEYDITGKIIAENINRFPEKVKIEIANIVYNQYLKPMRDLILSNKKREALILYLELVRKYKESFKIEGLIDLNYIKHMLEIKDDELCVTLYNELDEDENIFNKIRNIAIYFEKCINHNTKYKYYSVTEALGNILNSCSDENQIKSIINKYYNEFIIALENEILQDDSCYDNSNRICNLLETMLIKLNSEQISQDKLKRELI